jgi:hypothetical protein
VRSLTRDTADQLDRAYREMAAKARYRPCAPSDGFGHITVPSAVLNLDAECADYACGWAAEEDTLQFRIGCCNFDTRPATVYAIEAARCLCGGASGNDVARRLLQMAIDVLDSQRRRPRGITARRQNSKTAR